jgi:sec-independent protein translocase protein TatB
MFGLGFGEIVIIAILALILLGPDRLPEAAKQLGRTLREIRKHTDDLKEQFEAEVYGDGKKPGMTKPALVPPVPAKPAGPEGPPPPATHENVPGLEAAFAGEPEPLPAPPPPAEPPAAVVAAAPPEAAPAEKT